jgi:hypothetical protein
MQWLAKPVSVVLEMEMENYAKNVPKSFRPKRSLVKSIPGQAFFGLSNR